MIKKLLLYKPAVLLVATLIPAQIIYAQGPTTEGFYRENNITFFGEDPANTCAPGGSTPAAGGGETVGGEVTGDKGKAVYDFFIAKGLRPWMAAGILGNLVAESGLNSGIENGIGAYGLAQWLGSRKAGLQEFANNQSKPIDDFGMQLEFIWFEFNNEEKSAGDAIKATTSLADVGNVDGAVRVVMEKYERPSAGEQKESFPKRLAAAEKGLEVHGNGAPASGEALAGEAPDQGSAVGTPVTGGCGPTAGNFTGAPGQTQPQGDGFTLADNTDYSGTPCAPGSNETQVYLHPTRGFRVRLCDAGSGFVVASIISDRVVAMLAAAQSAGVPLRGSAFRSYERQKELRIENGCRDDSLPSRACSPPTAPPGNSQHERGLALDFANGGTIRPGSPEFNWLSANAATYGLINWEVEPWHWSTSGS